jgi:hypothetical protein
VVTPYTEKQQNRTDKMRREPAPASQTLLALLRSPRAQASTIWQTSPGCDIKRNQETYRTIVKRTGIAGRNGPTPKQLMGT